MPSSRHAQTHSAVILLATEREIRRPPGAESACASGTNSKAEIISLSSGIRSDMSPTVPEVRTGSTHTKTRKRPTAQRQSDDQYSIEQIGAVIRGMSDRELKARFPKAHKEHQTLKRKTRRKNSWDQLHPAFAKFSDFLRHMGPAPHPDSSIDRIDLENPVYGPGTCQWASPQEQARRRSTNVWITWRGERHTLIEWAELSGISYETLRGRHKRKWTEAKMFADAPVRRYRTPPAPRALPPAPKPAGTYTYTVGDIPVMPSNGWPDGFPDARQYETGYIQATRRKERGVSMSRAHFGAWIAGSKIKELQREIDVAGLTGYLHFRDNIQPEDIADIDRRACACWAIREYYALIRFSHCFVGAYLDEQAEKSQRSTYAQRNPRESAMIHLRDLIRRRPCSSPHDAWETFQE